MAITIEKETGGAITIGNSTFNYGDLKITFFPVNGKVTILDRNNDNEILRAVHYSNITNPDTDVAFVSFAALKTWLLANVLTTSDAALIEALEDNTAASAALKASIDLLKAAVDANTAALAP